jgi:hypothetical protein
VDIYIADFLSERSFGKQNHFVHSSSDLAYKLLVQHFSQAYWQETSPGYGGKSTEGDIAV